MRKPLVSVIMSRYNGEKYIKKSVSSIINQTYENWELIFGIIIQVIILQK